MRAVETASATAYGDAAQAHAELARKQSIDGKPLSGEALRAARDRRTAAARRVLEAWRVFDQTLREAPDLGRSPDVLAVFRLNDTLYSRAKWFVDHPDSNRLPPLLVPDGAPPERGARPAGRPRAAAVAAAKSAADLDDRLDLAPPRIAWARRYGHLMRGPAYKLVQVQEAHRFAERERAARSFEQALIDRAAPTDAKAALQAARLGLYTGGEQPGSVRVPLAAKLTSVTGDVGLDQALAARGVQLF